MKLDITFFGEGGMGRGGFKSLCSEGFEQGSDWAELTGRRRWRSADWDLNCPPVRLWSAALPLDHYLF